MSDDHVRRSKAPDRPPTIAVSPAHFCHFHSHALPHDASGIDTHVSHLLGLTIGLRENPVGRTQ
jgi:hypothetical protein